MPALPWKSLLLFWGLLALLILTTRGWLWPLNRQNVSISKVAQLPTSLNGDFQLSFSGENITENLRVNLQQDLSHRHLVAESWKTWGQTNDFALYQNYAYLVDRDFGLLVIDVSEPGQMHLVHSVDLPEEGWKISIRDGLAVVALPRYGLQIFDLSRPSRPELMTSFPLEGKTHDVVVADHRILTVSLPLGIQVIDAREPRAPKLLGHVDIPGLGSQIVVDGTTAAVACRSGGVVLLDLGEEGVPQKTFTLATDFPAYYLALRGNQLAVAYSFPKSFDLFEIRGNRVVNSRKGPRGLYIRALALERGRLLVGADDGFWMFQPDDNAELREIVHMETEGRLFALAQDDTRVFLIGRSMPLTALKWSVLNQSEDEAIRQTYPDVFDIAVKEEHLFLAGTPYGLRIAEMSDSLEPGHILANLGPSWKPSMVVAVGNSALVAGEKEGLGLLRYDPISGGVEESWLETNAISAMKIHAGRYALIAESRGRLGILDLDRNQSNGIKWLSSLIGPGNSVDVNNSWIAISEEMVGVEIIGWDGVGEETSRRFLPFDVRIRQVRLKDDMLYVLTYDGELYRMPLEPVDGFPEETHLNPGKPIGGMEKYDDRIYLIQNDGSIFLLESGDEQVSKLIGNVLPDNNPGMLRICAGKGRLYLSNYQGLFVYEILKSGRLSLISHMKDDRRITSMSTDSDLFWTVSLDMGLVLFEKGESGNLVTRKQWQLQGREVVIVDQAALVRTGDGLLVVDIADPRRPHLIDRRRVGWDVTGLCRINDLIVLVDKKMGMFVFELTDDQRLMEVSTLALPGKPWGAVAFDNKVLIPSEKKGLVVVDLANPSVPLIVAAEELPPPLAFFATARGVAVYDRTIYVAQGRAGVQILQLDSEGYPELAGLFDTSYFARRVQVVGRRLFVADIKGGVLVYDLSDPLNPEFEDVIDAGDRAKDLIAVGDEIWVPEPMRRAPKPVALDLGMYERKIVATVPGTLGDGWYSLRVMEPGVGVLWEGFLEKSGDRLSVKTDERFQ